MTTQHTSGPWRTSEHQLLVMSGRTTVAEVRIATIPYEEQAANARLIASAPELLAALEQLVEEMKPTRPDWHLDISTEGQRMARAAIAKARGNQPPVPSP